MIGKKVTKNEKKVKGCQKVTKNCGTLKSSHNPDPPTLAFFGGRQKENRPKKQGFSLCGTPKNPWKRKENAQKRKQGKSENEKSKEKKLGLQGQGIFEIGTIFQKCWP